MKYLVCVWSKIVWFLAWVYRCTFQLVFNVLANLYWLIRIVVTGKFMQAVEKSNVVYAQGKDFAHAREVFEVFKYRYKGLVEKAPKWLKVFTMWPTWTAMRTVLAHRDLHGNCQDATQLANWLMFEVNARRRSLNLETAEVHTQIYVPICPWQWHRVHYFVTVIDAGVIYQFTTNGMGAKIFENVSRDALANTFLNKQREAAGKKPLRWVWL